MYYNDYMKKNNGRIIKVDVDDKYYLVNVKKNKSHYIRLSVGRFNKEYNCYVIGLSHPRIINDKEVHNLINNYKDIIEKQLAKKNDHLRLSDGEAMIFGKIVTIEEFNKNFNNCINYIKERFLILSKKANVYGVDLVFRKMKSRWGSYNKTKKIITLNKWLVILPLELIDYVICHELTHHYVFDHSKEFYNYLAKLYPDYLVARKAIKNYSDIV